MAKTAAQQAEAGQSPAQRAGSAKPGDTPPAASTGDLDSPQAVADAQRANAILAAQAEGITDPATIATMVPRSSGAIPYTIDGEVVTHAEYVEHVAAQEREAAAAALAEADEALHGKPPSNEGAK